METTWILTADASRAKIFESLAPRADLHEIKDFSNPEGRANNQEVNTDAGGRFFGKGERQQGHTADPQVEAVQHQTELFSKTVGDYLERARAQHRYEKLCVIAPPKVLGLLRQNLSKEVQKLIDQEIGKDLSKLDAKELKDYISAQGQKK